MNSKHPDTAIETRNGISFDLLSPQPDMVNIADIAEHLAKLCRFTGATDMFYSVAQHSLLVADHVSPQARPFALLHDAHEAYLGDWTTPLKQAVLNLMQLYTSNGTKHHDPLNRLETAISIAIHEAAGLTWPVPSAIAAEIKAADLAALASERDALMTKGGLDWPGLKGIDPLPVNIKPLPWPDAADKFYQALADAHLIPMPKPTWPTQIIEL